MRTEPEITKELAEHFKRIEADHKAYLAWLQRDSLGRSNQKINTNLGSRVTRDFKRRIKIRNQDKTTQIEAIGSIGSIDLRIKSKVLSPQQRRVMGVTFIRQIKPWLEYFTTLRLDHWEHMKIYWGTNNSGIPIFKSRPLDTPTGKLGVEIRMRRLELGWTQRDLAKKAGVGSCHLSEIERGLRSPRATTIGKLEAALGASLYLEQSRKSVNKGIARKSVVNNESR
jgi:DNA-binding XRE family transcriptional regulator